MLWRVVFLGVRYTGIPLLLHMDFARIHTANVVIYSLQNDSRLVSGAALPILRRPAHSRNQPIPSPGRT